VRFSDGRPADELEDLLGARARALEARVALGSGPGRIALWLEPEGLEPAERERLERAAGVGLSAPRTGLARIELAPARLEELGSSGPGLRCLAAAGRAAARRAGPPRVMGILNVTPDSFSDGGAYLGTEAAIAHGRALIQAGADLVDVGGESTRPGAAPVSEAAECERVVPVIAALAREGQGILSVDTSRTAVARAALEAGARAVNDVRAGTADPELLALVAEAGAGVILMHMRGSPRDMQADPHYADVVREVTAFLRARAGAAVEAGIDPACIALDPGIGFGKRLEHNLALLRALPELRSLGFPLVLGVSRKSFLGALSGEAQPARRGAETLAAVSLGAFLGAEIHRVHEVAPVRAALRVVSALAADKEPAAMPPTSPAPTPLSGTR